MCEVPWSGNSAYGIGINVGPTCTFSSSSRCLDGNCTCRNIFGKVCGTLVGDVLLYIDNRQNSWAQYVPDALDALGISNIKTLVGDLTFDLDGYYFAYGEWAVNAFPNLEVIRGRNRNTPAGGEVILGQLQVASYSPLFNLLPGPGLSKLRVVSYIALASNRGSERCVNTDLAFLSSLECVGGVLSFRGNSLQSLRGLERVVDGLPAVYPNLVGSGYTTAKFWIGGTPANVSALAAYARCGGTIRPDTAPENVYIVVPCGNTTSSITTWSGLCTYIANGTCA